MTVHTQKTSFIKVILIACAAFLLRGCRLEGTIDYRPGAKPVLSFEVEETTGSMTELKRTCEDVKVSAQTNARFIKNPKVEDLTPPGGNIRCRVSSTEPMIGVTVLTEKSGKYYINIPKWKISGDFSDFKLRMTIIMPGKVTKANTGKIEGNKVMIDDPNVWFKGISITAEKEGASSSSASSGESTRPSNEKTGAKSSQNNSGDSFPAWGWALSAAAFWHSLQEPGSFSDANDAQPRPLPPASIRCLSPLRLGHNRQTPMFTVRRPQTQPPIHTTPGTHRRRATATTRPRPLLKHRTPTRDKTIPAHDTAHGKSRSKVKAT